MWTHLYLGLELPISGPGPITNRSRRNGARDIYQYVGDYTNPILKPQAAEIVKQRGETSLTGVVASLTNQCWPGGIPYGFWNSGIQLLQQPHQITISMTTTLESATYARTSRIKRRSRRPGMGISSVIMKATPWL